MDDYYEYIKQGKTVVRLSIWESSKIPLGFVKWQVQQYESELQWWVNCGVTGVTTFDRALQQGREFMHRTFEVQREMIK